VKLLVLDREIECWSKVRNELNGLRPRSGEHDVCISINADGSPGVPIMPRPFALGTGTITGFKEHPDPNENHGYLYPVFIRTDRVADVPEWELDENGFYLRPTGRMVKDYFNGIHFSTSDYTQGCLRLAKEADARWLWHNAEAGTAFEVVG
jgi:hypothetical protein